MSRVRWERVSSLATSDVSPGDDGRPEPTRWTIHGERLVDDTRRLRLSIAQVELPDGVRFEQYVLRMPKAAMTVLIDDARERVLMIWRHRFVPDCWTWELPGGYVDSDEDPAVTASREVEEETGWRPRSMTLSQPLVGSADFENLLFLAEGAEDTEALADIKEAVRVEWITLDSVRDRIAPSRDHRCGHPDRAAARPCIPHVGGNTQRGRADVAGFLNSRPRS
ncbi:MAG: NUDIX hydrolase [Pseudonocardiaceae bacterium]